MSGRPRTPIGTFGEINVRKVERGLYRASTRFRDWDGQSRQVTATAGSRTAVLAELKQRILERQAAGSVGDTLHAGSPFLDLADAWLEHMRSDADLADGTKDVYERQLRSLVLPTFQHLSVREVTVARLDRFLRDQRAKSDSRAKYSRTMLSLVMGFAVRREIIARNPVKDVAPMKTSKKQPKALTDQQVALIRQAARCWRAGPGVRGPRPDGQVRDVIEVMLGAATRIGEALAIRKCDVDMTVSPPTVSINGTIVVLKGLGVVRQPKPKTDDSNRVVAIPSFAATVIRRRLAHVGGADGEHLLFFTRNGTPLAPNNVRRTFREMLRSVGLEGLEITPHAFRRTAATLVATEIDIETAADVLGHSSVTTTKAHYVQDDRPADPRTAQVLERLAPKAS